LRKEQKQKEARKRQKRTYKEYKRDMKNIKKQFEEIRKDEEGKKTKRKKGWYYCGFDGWIS